MYAEAVWRRARGLRRGRPGSTYIRPTSAPRHDRRGRHTSHHAPQYLLVLLSRRLGIRDARRGIVSAPSPFLHELRRSTIRRSWPPGANICSRRAFVRLGPRPRHHRSGTTGQCAAAAPGLESLAAAFSAWRPPDVVEGWARRELLGRGV